MSNIPDWLPKPQVPFSFHRTDIHRPSETQRRAVNALVGWCLVGIVLIGAGAFGYVVGGAL